MKAAWAVAVLVALALAGPADALAHATLKSSSPGFRERLESSPASVVLRFDQAVTVFANGVEVRTATGRRVSGPARTARDPRVVEAHLHPLERGPYTVRWRVVASEGHVVSGVFTFGVRYPAPPPSEAFGASGPGRDDQLVRWAYFVALSLVLGSLGFRLLVLPAPTARVQRRVLAVAGVGVVAMLEVGIAGFVMRADDALQVPFARLLYGDLSPLAYGTRFGQAFVAMTLGFAAVAALLVLAWIFDRPTLLWPAFILGIGFSSGLPLSGHSASSGAIVELADWIHLVAACLWLGGLVMLALVWAAEPALRRTAILRFSRLAVVLVVAVVGAGAVLAFARLPEPADLWGSHYGRVLLVKSGLVALALAWGALHNRMVASGAAVSPRIARSLAAEGAVVAVVLLAAAVLVNTQPPVERPQGPVPARGAR